MNLDYAKIISSKKVAFEPRGLTRVPALNSKLFPLQANVVEFSLRAGCAGTYLDTGLGKSGIELEFLRVVTEHLNKPTLLYAPLGVAHQHVREANFFGIDARVVRSPADMKGNRVYVTNYDNAHKFDMAEFGGVAIDEAGILKAFTGATSRGLIAANRCVPFRLAASATPAPNDHMELGQQSMFLGVMDSSEMLARWFMTDQAEMGRYRLKKPAVKSFWEWVASWARCASMPSDLGFSDEGYVLPPLTIHKHIVASDISLDRGEEKSGQMRLLRTPENSATSLFKEKRLSLTDRCDQIASVILAEAHEPWVTWVETNSEADAMQERIPSAVEVRGDMHPDMKEERLIAFVDGDIQYLITKPRIAGYGSNWQHCARMAKTSINYSFEEWYQLIRRAWRFGQKRPVHMHVAMADTEMNAWQTIQRKERENASMKEGMRQAMKRAMASHGVMDDYNPVANVRLPVWLQGAA